jgi:hypothetical protein
MIRAGAAPDELHGQRSMQRIVGRHRSAGDTKRTMRVAKKKNCHKSHWEVHEKLRTLQISTEFILTGTL